MKVYAISKEEKEEVRRVIIDALKDKGEIIFAYLHGSFLEGGFQDVDVAVFLSELKISSKREVLRCELELERELEEVISLPIDVRILNHAPLYFKFEGIKGGDLLFSRNEGVRCDFECLTFVEHHDFDFHKETYRREALGIEV